MKNRKNERKSNAESQILMGVPKTRRNNNVCNLPGNHLLFEISNARRTKKEEITSTYCLHYIELTLGSAFCHEPNRRMTPKIILLKMRPSLLLFFFHIYIYINLAL